MDHMRLELGIHFDLWDENVMYRSKKYQMYETASKSCMGISTVLVP